MDKFLRFLYKKNGFCCICRNQVHVFHVSICNSQELLHSLGGEAPSTLRVYQHWLERNLTVWSSVQLDGLCKICQHQDLTLPESPPGKKNSAQTSTSWQGHPCEGLWGLLANWWPPGCGLHQMPSRRWTLCLRGLLRLQPWRPLPRSLQWFQRHQSRLRNARWAFTMKIKRMPKFGAFRSHARN